MPRVGSFCGLGGGGVVSRPLLAPRRGLATFGVRWLADLSPQSTSAFAFTWRSPCAQVSPSYQNASCLDSGLPLTPPAQTPFPNKSRFEELGISTNESGRPGVDGVCTIQPITLNNGPKFRKQNGKGRSGFTRGLETPRAVCPRGWGPPAGR